MKIIKNFSNTDKKLLAACAIATLICILLLSPLGDYFLQSSNVDSRSGKVLGKISFQKNDVRHRYKSEMTWLQAKDEQNISVGDSVFAGPDSTARVDLENSNNVTVSENSLVVFEEIDKVRFANLQTGNFRLKVNGKLKIAIQGDLREISGTDAEIQIFTDKNNKPKLRLLKGSASIRKANKPPINLINGEIASLNHVEHKIPIGEDKQKQEAPILQKPQQLVKYIWRLYDHFERLEDQLAPKKDLPKKVLLQTKISWLLTQRQQTFFELSSLSDFQESIKATTSTHFIDLNEVFIGENFIRVSQDQLNWGKTEKFIVETKFLENVEPFAKISASDFPLISDSVKVPISLQTAAENPIGLVGQYSGDEIFRPDKT
jgi:hypothetical protein